MQYTSTTHAPIYTQTHTKHTHTHYIYHTHSTLSVHRSLTHPTHNTRTSHIETPHKYKKIIIYFIKFLEFLFGRRGRVGSAHRLRVWRSWVRFHRRAQVGRGKLRREGQGGEKEEEGVYFFSQLAFFSWEKQVQRKASFDERYKKK